MQYVSFDDLSTDLKNFFLATALGQGLTTESLSQSLQLIQRMSIDDLLLLKAADFAKQTKSSSENQMIRMCMNERLTDQKLDYSNLEPIFIYTAEHTVDFQNIGKEKIHVVNCDTTIRARESFVVEPFRGQYEKAESYHKCEATNILLTDRVGFPPIVSSIRIKFGDKSKVISERSFRTTPDQWKIFMKASSDLVKELYDLDEVCYRTYFIEALEKSAKKEFFDKLGLVTKKEQQTLEESLLVEQKDKETLKFILDNHLESNFRNVDELKASLENVKSLGDLLKTDEELKALLMKVKSKNVVK